MDRRSFIKLTAVSGASATLAGCGVPEHQLIRFVPDEEVVPGIEEWKPSVCPLCASGCGLRVRVMPADVETSRNDQQGVVRQNVAKKLEGNAAHPVNQGGLCARGQAAIQVVYHPDRIVQPLRRTGTRGDGQFEALSWDDAISRLVSRLDALAAARDSRALRFVTGGRQGQRHALIERFLAAFGAPPAVRYELFGDDVLRRANLLSYGREQLPTFDLGQTNVVLSFGADFLGTWNSPVSQSAAYGQMRQGRRGVRGFFVQVEARMTTTGANADEWLPVTPGTEGVLALGVAHVILAGKRHTGPATGPAGALVDGWTNGLPEYAPEKVAAITGVPAARVEWLARELVERSPAVAIIAGPPLAHTNALFSALAVNALNELLGAIGRPGGVHFTPQVASLTLPPGGGGSLRTMAAQVNDGTGALKILMIDGANPVFAAPRAWKVREAIERVPFVVSFASFIDETSVLADLILPDHAFLESWTEAVPESGSLSSVLGVAPPVMAPLFGTRAMPDVLLDVSRKISTPLGLRWQTFEEMLRGTFEPLGEDAWTAAQEQGGWWGPIPSTLMAPPRAGSTAALSKPAAYAAPAFSGEAEQYPFHLLPYPSLQFLDGSLAHLPWLQELPDPMTSAMWSSWVEINPRTCERLGLAQGDIVEVASSIGALTAPVFVNPALAPDVMAMPVGQGHQTFTRFASGRGSNPVEILAPVSEPETGALAWAATRVKVSRVGDPDGTLILFSARGELREKPNEGATR